MLDVWISMPVGQLNALLLYPVQIVQDKTPKHVLPPAVVSPAVKPLFIFLVHLEEGSWIYPFAIVWFNQQPNPHNQVWKAVSGFWFTAGIDKMVEIPFKVRIV